MEPQIYFFMKLTDRKIKTFKPPLAGRINLSDGNGLSLRITDKNHKSWSYQYRYQGRRLRYSIGNYPFISLKEARRIAFKAQMMLANQQDPQLPRRKENIILFKDAFQIYLNRYIKKELRTAAEFIDG